MRTVSWRSVCGSVVFSLALTLAGLFMVQATGVGYAAEAAEPRDAGESAEPADKAEALSPGKLGALAAERASRWPAWTQREFLDVAVWQFLLAFVFVLLGLVLKRVSDFAFANKIIPLAEKTPFEFDTLVATAASKPVGYLLLIWGLYTAVSILPLPEKPVDSVAKIIVDVTIVWFLFRAVDVGVHYLSRLAARTESRLDDQVVPMVKKALKVTVGAIGFVWIVQHLGYNVSSLIAGLGIGGLAVALALQDTLANFFGAVFLFLDRPFAVRDWIKVGDVEGVVEEIGFRSTRVRTWPATLVTVPNKTVANATVDNWSRMPKRRVMQTVGVTYETTAEQMEQVVKAIREIVENDDGVDKEFIVIRFTDFGESSLNILVYYFTKATAFADHMATKERINLAIMRAVRDMGLSIAFPTRTVYFEGDVADKLAGHLGGGSGKDTAGTQEQST
jgi:MscS family membrane protein